MLFSQKCYECIIMKTKIKTICSGEEFGKLKILCIRGCANMTSAWKGWGSDPANADK